VAIQEAGLVSNGRVSSLQPSKMLAQEVAMVCIYQVDVGYDYIGKQQCLESRSNLVGGNFRLISLDDTMTNREHQW
jgi:hypothetical protein